MYPSLPQQSAEQSSSGGEGFIWAERMLPGIQTHPGCFHDAIAPLEVIITTNARGVSPICRSGFLGLYRDFAYSADRLLSYGKNRSLLTSNTLCNCWQSVTPNKRPVLATLSCSLRRVLGPSPRRRDARLLLIIRVVIFKTPGTLSRPLFYLYSNRNSCGKGFLSNHLQGLLASINHLGSTLLTKEIPNGVWKTAQKESTVCNQQTNKPCRYPLKAGCV